MQQVLAEIAQEISHCYGDDFFQKITLALDKVIGSDYTFIAKLDLEKRVSQTVTLVSKGKLLENFEYALQHTPCEDVANDSLCLYRDGVTAHFPQDQLLIDMGISGYLGAPLHDNQGHVMGLVVALYQRPIKDEELTQALFELFSGRIAGEFERQKHETNLQHLNHVLDKKVEERTAELAQTVEDLRNAHDLLIESEKLAALGGMISGVAHEVNTPLGVSITATSVLKEKYQNFKSKLDNGGISRSDLDVFLESVSSTVPLIEHNLYRSKELVDDFKRTAAEQMDIKSAQIALHPYYRRVISTLTPLLKQKNVNVAIESCDEIVNTYPGYHAQILTGLVNNSVQHGFMQSEGNTINITISKIDQTTFKVVYKDNGIGISPDSVSKVIEPFYTTNRASGSKGLGLAICHNLATNALHGSFLVKPSKQGAHIEYCFSPIDLISR
ncbi:ATP-binding protein [Thalassotalea euphylliae]|uniref:GAF domain-containing sensor histidine kinase n=1 Tax=Thalassotalea euphylliae TaxID=1655234 RepID=UPI0036420CF4